MQVNPRGSWIPDSTLWIPDSICGRIPDFKILFWIPDSKAVDSGFHRPKLPGFRITYNERAIGLCDTYPLDSDLSTGTVAFWTTEETLHFHHYEELFFITRFKIILPRWPVIEKISIQLSRNQPFHWENFPSIIQYTIFWRTVCYHWKGQKG